MTRASVHVVLARIPVETASELERRFRAWLSPEEWARYEELRAPNKRREFLVTRALVRQQLSRFAPIDPLAWRFQSNGHGRPEIANQGVQDLRFNLSNTRGLVACVMAEGIEVGIDVEDITVERETVGIANRFFSPAEVQELKALPESAQRDRFFDYWTLKESYIKARGLGLAIPLDRFTFRFDPLRIELDPSVGTDAATWHFWLESPLPEYRLAAAARQSAGTGLALSVEWAALPM